MENTRQKELLELLALAQEEVVNGNEVSTEFARVLFPPARKEYELTYYGKESEQAIISQTFAAPLQENRRFGEVTESDWLNKIIFGDNLQVLKTLVEMKHRGELTNADGTKGVRLIYIDPPFHIREGQEKIYEKTLNLIKIAEKFEIDFIAIEHISSVKFDEISKIN